MDQRTLHDGACRVVDEPVAPAGLRVLPGAYRKVPSQLYVSIAGISQCYPEGPHIQPLGNWAPKCHTIEGIMGPNSLLVVYVDPLGYSCL